jgi:hypothetical protein
MDHQQILTSGPRALPQFPGKVPNGEIEQEQANNKQRQAEPRPRGSLCVRQTNVL